MLNGRFTMRIHVRRVLLIAAGLLVLPALAGPAPAHAVADGCAAGMTADFNGDGRSDALVGDSNATVNGQADAGRIVVMYGDADGLVGEGSRDVLWQGEESVAGVAEAGDRFGFAIATADVDCDGYTDAVVGTPNEDIGAQSNSGYVQVIWGSPTGLGTGAASTQYTQATFGHSITAGDQFGYAVDVVEDLGQGGTGAPFAFALAIGVPGANDAGADDAGALALQMAYDGGFERHWITQESPGVVGTSESGDRFGQAVTCGYLSSPDAVADVVDCAVGAPYEDIGAASNAGSVVVLEELYFVDELTSFGLSQDADGVPGTAEAGDHYGATLDSVRVGGTSWLAVGVPDENLGSVVNAGSVQLFSSDRRDIEVETALTQDTSGVSDSGQTNDRFGAALAWIAPGLGDTRTRLAIGAPGESVGGDPKAGMVQVFAMGYLSSEKTYTQDSAGIIGAASDDDGFGSSLATVAGATERVLLIGSPDDSGYASGMVTVLPFAGGTPRAWLPGTGGVPSTGASRFGGSLGGVNGGTT